MNFVVDAHLPKAFCSVIENSGHKAFHTRNLPLGNKTPDEAIVAFALENEAVVITKDTDFYYSFILRGKPRKLILIKFGNQRLQRARLIFSLAFPEILNLISQYDLLELYSDKVVAVK